VRGAQGNSDVKESGKNTRCMRLECKTGLILDVNDWWIIHFDK